MFTLLLVCVIAPLGKPPALIAMEKARESLTSAEVYWSNTFFYGDRAGNTTYLRSLYAGDDVASTEFGDSEGVVSRDADGKPTGILPWSVLIKRGSGVLFQNRNATAQVFETSDLALKEMIRDMRTMGMLPKGIDPSAHPRDYLATYPTRDTRQRSYSQTQVDGIYKVEMDTENSKTVWYIDPNTGWSCTRSELRELSGALVNYSETAYQKYGDTWLPVSTAYMDRNDELRVFQEVSQARVNDKDLPSSLSPADIGVEVGVAMLGSPNSGSQQGQYNYWDGQNVVSKEEFDRRMKAGDLELGPSVKEFFKNIKKYNEAGVPYNPGIPLEVLAPEGSAAYARLSNAGLFTKPPATQPSTLIIEPKDPWDVYAIKFIKDYKLDQEQSSKTLQILEDFKVLRQKYLNMLPTSAKRVEDTTKLLRNVDNMFDNGLKPRLQRLPTRRQKAEFLAAQSPVATPSSAPATHP
jgi:hypothetical protein